MNRLALVMHLKSGCEEAYLEAHRNVWPELIDAAHKAGIRNHSVFIQGSRLFVYVEADDVDKSLQDLAQCEVKQRWDARMNELLDPERPPEPLAEAFHID